MRKSDAVRVYHKKERGVKVHHKKKSDGLTLYHERKSDGVRIYHEKDRWGESSQQKRAMR